MRDMKNENIEKKSNLLVYLVDDDNEDQEIFHEALDQIDAKIELSVFDCGKAIIDELQTNGKKPDLIFLDLYMPFMDGEECLKKIREKYSSDTISIVMYSTEFDIDRIEQLMSFGANKYLRKPDSFDSLITSLETIFDSFKSASHLDSTINIVNWYSPWV